MCMEVVIASAWPEIIDMASELGLVRTSLTLSLGRWTLARDWMTFWCLPL